MKAFDLITITDENKTDPEVPMGTAIIIVENGIVDIGRLEFHKKYESLAVSHPKNEGELKVKAKALIEKKAPELLRSKSMITLICPESLGKEMIF